MGVNNLEIYKDKVKTIQCTVVGLSSLEGFIAKLIAKKEANEDSAVIIESEGSISELVITFDLTATLTDVDPYEYVYYIILDDEAEEPERHTIIEDILKIKYSP